MKLPIRTVLLGVRSVTRPAAAEEEATTPAAGRGAERLVFWRKGDAGVRPLDDLVRRRRFQRFLLAFSEKIRWAGSGSSSSDAGPALLRRVVPASADRACFL